VVVTGALQLSIVNRIERYEAKGGGGRLRLAGSLVCGGNRTYVTTIETTDYAGSLLDFLHHICDGGVVSSMPVNVVAAVFAMIWVGGEFCRLMSGLGGR